jgi:hypothetical protein
MQPTPFSNISSTPYKLGSLWLSSCGQDFQTSIPTRSKDGFLLGCGPIPDGYDFSKLDSV